MLGQLTWLVYIIAAIIGGHSFSSSNIKEGEETIDADLARRMIELMRLLDERMSLSVKILCVSLSFL